MSNFVYFDQILYTLKQVWRKLTWLQEQRLRKPHQIHTENITGEWYTKPIHKNLGEMDGLDILMKDRGGN